MCIRDRGHGFWFNGVPKVEVQEWGYIGTQLNNTEWTPYYLIALLYLHTQQAGHAYTAYASVLACVAYTSVKLLTNGKPAPLIAFMRYNVLMVLIYEVYSTR